MADDTFAMYDNQIIKKTDINQIKCTVCPWKEASYVEDKVKEEVVQQIEKINIPVRTEYGKEIVEMIKNTIIEELCKEKK